MVDIEAKPSLLEEFKPLLEEVKRVGDVREVLGTVTCTGFSVSLCRARPHGLLFVVVTGRASKWKALVWPTALGSTWRVYKPPRAVL